MLVPALLPYSRVWATGAGVACALACARHPRLGWTLAAYAAPSVFGAPWPVHCFTAAAVWLVLARRDGIEVRRPPRSVAPRPLDVALCLALGLTSGAIVVWLDWSRIVANGFSFPQSTPPVWLLGVVVLVLAVVNAVGEELIWRVALVLEQPWTSLLALYAIQAITFGLAHWNGIPRGAAGVMAAAVYSALLYAISRRYGPWMATLTHIVTDVVIFAMIAANASFLTFGFA